ncbi:MAG TPA: pyridoxine 5'-phosphate synthase [Nitrospiria bacterium]|nr:pyridoxine 5'-phosphate synthase [Nitrospiria bacterium]
MPRTRAGTYWHGMAQLGLKLDHVATLRQVRGGIEPNVAAAALLAEMGGADWLIAHLREDRRHIQDRDLYGFQHVAPSRLTLEISAADRMLKFALELRPARVTVVPEHPMELTTEGGLDMIGKREIVANAAASLAQAGIPVTLLIQPSVDDVKACHRLGQPGLSVELNATAYRAAKTPLERRAWEERIVTAAKLAAKVGMPVQLGHGLTLDLVRAFAPVPEIAQFNVGHAVIARAALIGIEAAVREMKTAATARA